MFLSSVDAITISALFLPFRCDVNQSEPNSKSGETLSELIRTIEDHISVLKRLQVSRFRHNLAWKSEKLILLKSYQPNTVDSSPNVNV
jgi:hypothetical protein